MLQFHDIKSEFYVRSFAGLDVQAGFLGCFFVCCVNVMNIIRQIGAKSQSTSFLIDSQNC